MTVSVFDLFRIGVGPSSSHTVGPMLAGYQFAKELAARDPEFGRAAGSLAGGAVTRESGITIILYGSLAATGQGHGTLGACLIGLDGHAPDEVDPDYLEQRLKEIAETRTINLAGDPQRPVQCGYEDIILRPAVRRSLHTNAVTFSALLEGGEEFKRTYYSIGGGFIRTAEEEPQLKSPSGEFVFSSGAQLIDLAERNGISIAEVMRRCEQSLRDDAAIDDELDRIHAAMEACTKRGLAQTGILPGGLNVRRRAAGWYEQLLNDDPECTPAFSEDWVNLVALAVNEENAAGGRVVTAPTNGAAGIIPAVAFYATHFTPAGVADPKDTVRRFLLAAGAVGSLYKERASISGAEVGCQGEVGSAASMAAAGLAEVLGGTPRQVCNAAEIAMEHSLGLTCDPIGGLVQIPCIERNAISAGKAINAAKMALRGDGSHLVSLDDVIETMRQTGNDMSDRYKETAGGGLAITVGVNVVEC